MVDPRPCEKMTKYRSRIEQVYEVLSLLKRGVQLKTHLMYKANVSWTVLIEILDDLDASGCLTMKNRGRQTEIHITEQGEQVWESLRVGLNALEKKVGCVNDG